MLFKIGYYLTVDLVPEKKRMWSEPFKYVGQRFHVDNVKVITHMLEAPCDVMMELKITDVDTEEKHVIWVMLYDGNRNQWEGVTQELYDFQCHVKCGQQPYPQFHGPKEGGDTLQKGDHNNSPIVMKRCKHLTPEETVCKKHNLQCSYPECMEPIK